MNLMIWFAGIGGLLIITERVLITGQWVYERVQTLKYHSNVQRKLKLISMTEKTGKLKIIRKLDEEA